MSILARRGGDGDADLCLANLGGAGSAGDGDLDLEFLDRRRCGGLRPPELDLDLAFLPRVFCSSGCLFMLRGGGGGLSDADLRGELLQYTSRD